METISKSLIAAAIGALLLASAPARAADSSAWLERQFSTVHRSHSLTADTGEVATRASGADGQGESGHDFAASWLDRQFAGKRIPNAPADAAGESSRAAAGVDPDAPSYVAWLRNQFATASAARMPSL